MRLFSLAYGLLIIFGCKYSPENNKKTADSAKTEAATINPRYAKITDSAVRKPEGKTSKQQNPAENFENFSSKKIYRNILEFPEVTIQNPGDITENLYRLFPGNAYTINDYGKTLHTVFWQMGYNLKKRRISSTFIGEEHDIIFPRDEPWETRFEDSFYYEINGCRYFAMFFSSFNSCCDIHRSGRFSCAIVGCATFKQDSTGWIVVGYNPCIACFGMFGNPHSPVKIRLSDTEYGFYVTNGSQGPGTPYWSDIYFFRLDSNITPILKVNDFQRLNASLSSWTSKVHYETKGDSAYSIVIKTMGFLNDSDIDSFELESMHYLYRGLISKKGNYKFWHTKVYTPEANLKFRLEREKFNYKSWDLDTLNGNAYAAGSWFYDN